MNSLLIWLPILLLILLNLPFLKIRARIALILTALMAVYQIFVVLTNLPVGKGVENFLSTKFILNFSTDSLSLIVLLSIGIVLFVTALTGWETIETEPEKIHFYNLLLAALIGMNATTMTNDIFTLYIFVEATALSLFILIAMEKGQAGLEGAFKYLILSGVATAFMLISIALLILLSGSTTFDTIHNAIVNSDQADLVKLALAMFLGGLFVKSGLVPFHGWLPDAYSSAPSAVSVFLAGIVTKVTGVYVLMRVVLSVFGYSVPLQTVLMFFGTLSIVVGALAALTQNNFKRMLSYSSISQVGYIILGLGCGTPMALAGAAFHLFNHAIFKSLLFVNAAGVEQRLQTVDMDKMGGLAERMPFTGATSAIAFLSTAGVPPLSGFWSKLLIVLALWQSSHHYYAGIALLSSLLTLTYLLTMQRKVFFGKIRPELSSLREAGPLIVIPQVLLAGIIVAAGVFVVYFLNALFLPVGNLLG
ncbi:MAG: proton-conducting transporter membrane subunit [Candidatus Wallbacteria bacterium]|nr:proton-conducting transporter membrane subunit [Candidatus Wallbacteria bacterium]